MHGTDKVINRYESDLSKLVPGQSVDCVIISFENHRLYVLLLKWKGVGLWSLPGGFVYKDEDLDTAAKRVLKERTRIESPYLTQFYTFGNSNRRDGIEWNILLEMIDSNTTEIKKWISQRFITTGYIALVNKTKHEPVPDEMSEKCEWIPVEELPKLILDHRKIIQKAMKKLIIHINYLPIGIQLLPVAFTMKDLQKLYECILQKKLDRSNFQRKILKLGILTRIEKLRSGGAHKAPYLYSFNELKYGKLLKNGIGFVS